MLDRITPLVLTYNEAPNIARTLEQLRWARDIVVVDSFSHDDTLALVANFPQVRVFQRKFDSFAGQCNFGLLETGISSEWVLSLDADYVLTPQLIEELSSLNPDSNVDAFRADFAYCVNGRHLRSGVYPPVTVLFRRSRAKYFDDGHAHRVKIQGLIRDLRSNILHDDRKSLKRWFESQQKYTALEAEKILSSATAALSASDKVRRLRVIAPIAMLFYCLIIRGGILDGWPGFYYAFQRMLAELMLSLYLIEEDVKSLGKRRSVINVVNKEQDAMSKQADPAG